jgi:hypothetical protein
MKQAKQDFWKELFPAPAGLAPVVRVEMRLLRKRGRPFLLLPGQGCPASATLSLYPAQTGRARAARTLLRWLLRASLPLGLEKVSLTVSPTDAFTRFLSSLAGEPTGGLPVFGILAGNPMGEGQRLLLLVFDGQQRPVSVVKTGLSEQARELIEKEESFLKAVPEGTRAVPKVRAAFQSARLGALALDYFAGDAPRPGQEESLPWLLESWVDPKRKIAVADTPDWTRLEKACSGDGRLPAITGQLRTRTIQSAIHHGDFAPWNIKVSPTGAWTALDWERGELVGIPGWDWFHYIIQSANLVGHLPTAGLVQRVEGLLSSAAFQQYAARAGILGCERELVLAYLLHMVEVIKPSEGLPATRDLLQSLSSRWRKA